MDVNRDEIRRQLAESEREHAEAVPRFREMLKRLFDHESGASADDKAALLGVPSRRAFLTFGGATVAGSAVLAACATPKPKQLAVSGTTEAPPASTTTTAPGSKETDLVLLRTAQSIEVLAVQTYDKALATGLVTTASVSDALKLFKSQHQDHADLLATATKNQGGTPYDTANIYLDVEVVTPALAAATDEASVVALGVTLENLAAQTYTKAGKVLTIPDLRAAIMSIGATEARHLTVLYGVQGTNQVPLPFMSTQGAAPPESYIGPDGPVTPDPVAPTTTTSAAPAK
jgi:rubrerythrin